MNLQLTGPQLGKVRKAIVSAYGGAGPNALHFLNLALTDYIEGKAVFELVTVPAPFTLQVGELLSRANGEGWLPSLLSAVQQDKPEREDLQELLRSLLATAPARQALDLATGTGTVSAQVRAELQQILPGGAIVSPDTLQRRIRAVCRVEYADQSPPGAGTGFLVGPDLVLTNWHLLQRVIKAPPAARYLRFRFDLANAAAAADAAGRVAHAKADAVAVLRYSPPGGVELLGGEGEPTMQQLDYALVQLAEPVGDDPVPNGAAGETRGFIALRKTMPQPGKGAELMVLQHPLRGELQFAIGRVLGLNDTGTRIKHNAATLPGSSGSPVLDAALGLVGLHNAERPGTFNTAVPITRIVDDLIAAGVSMIPLDEMGPPMSVSNRTPAPNSPRAPESAHSVTTPTPAAISPSVVKPPNPASATSDWVKIHSFPQYLIHPTGIAVDPDNGTLFIADHERGHLVRIARREGVLETEGCRIFGNLKNPHHVVEVKDRVYLCDTDNHRLVCLDTNLSLLWIESKFGKQELYRPHGVASIHMSEQYLLNSGRHTVLRIVRATGNGPPKVTSIPTKPDKSGSDIGQFYEPCGLTVDEENKNILVADTYNHRVVILSCDLKLLGQFGSPGEGPSNLKFPVGLAKLGRWILVADEGNHRLQLWEENLSTGVHTATPAASNLCKEILKSPFGLTFDGEDCLWVTDRAGGGILEIDFQAMLAALNLARGGG